MLENLDIIWEAMDILRQEIMINIMEDSFGRKEDFWQTNELNFICSI